MGTWTNTDLLDGIAVTLATEATRRAYQPKPTGLPAAGPIGIYQGATPGPRDSRITTMGLNASTLATEPDMILSVQFRIEAADPRVIADVLADISDVFAERWGGSLGSVELTRSAFAYEADLGADASGRLGRTVNYEFTAHRTSPHRAS
jgi:hypothetical protein